MKMQEAYDTNVQWFLLDGHKPGYISTPQAGTPGKCVYFDFPTGRRCAIGCVLTAEGRSMVGTCCDDILGMKNDYDGMFSAEDLETVSIDEQFLLGIQSAHDDAARLSLRDPGIFSYRFAQRLITLGKNWGLNTDRLNLYLNQQKEWS